jgi:hypothetical protein
LYISGYITTIGDDTINTTFSFAIVDWRVGVWDFWRAQNFGSPVAAPPRFQTAGGETWKRRVANQKAAAFKPQTFCVTSYKDTTTVVHGFHRASLMGCRPVNALPVPMEVEWNCCTNCVLVLQYVGRTLRCTVSTAAKL